MIRATIIACLALAASAIPLRQGSYVGQQDIPNPRATVIRATIRPGNVMDFVWDFSMYRMTASWDCRDVPFSDHSDRIEINPRATPCVAQIPDFFARFFTLEGNLVMRKTDENTLHLVTGLMDCVNVFLRFTGGPATTTTTSTTTTTTTPRRTVPVSGAVTTTTTTTTTTPRRSVPASGAVTTATTTTTTRRPHLHSGSSSTTVSAASSSTASTSSSSTASTTTPSTTGTTTVISTTTIASNTTTASSVAPVNSTTTAVPTNASTPSPRVDNTTTTTSGKSASVAGSIVATIFAMGIVFAL